MDTLPPHTALLRRGLGLGTRRAYTATPGRMIAYDAPRDRPERETEVLRDGALPGGLDGILAYHTHLAEGPGEGHSWAAWTHTVVYAEVPAANRVLGVASFGHTEPVRAAFTIGRRDKGSDPLPAFRFDLPAGVRVEVEHGVLCAWMDGRVTDPARLQTLCRAAAEVADGLRAAAAAEPALDLERPVGPPAGRGAPALDWPEPPADVDTAVAAYGRLVRGRSRRFGLLAGLLFFLVAGLGAAAALAVGLMTGFAAGGVITGAFAVWLLWRIVRAAVSTGRELSAAERDARARPWGVEAFAQAYGQARGLSVEDPAVVQRRFDSPVRGRAVAAWHGPDGHLLLWRAADQTRWIVRVGPAGVSAERADWSAAALDAVPVAA